MAPQTTQEFTLTYSPRDKDDIDLLGLKKEITDNYKDWIISEHNESGHWNAHIYVKASRSMRTDNFRRKYLKFIKPETSNPYFALRCTASNGVKGYVNYVLHEDSVKMEVSPTLTEEVKELRRTYVKVVHIVKPCTLTKTNIVRKIVEYIKNHGLVIRQKGDLHTVVKGMIKQGYTFVGLRQYLADAGAEILFLLNDDDSRLSRYANVMFTRDIEDDILLFKPSI